MAAKPKSEEAGEGEDGEDGDGGAEGAGEAGADGDDKTDKVCVYVCVGMSVYVWLFVCTKGRKEGSIANPIANPTRKVHAHWCWRLLAVGGGGNGDGALMSLWLLGCVSSDVQHSSTPQHAAHPFKKPTRLTQAFYVLCYVWMI